MFNFGDAERHLLSLFLPGAVFICNGVSYAVVCTGKPTCPAGEPKTDIYVLARNNSGAAREFKISYKQDNADFLENKISAIRAEQILGVDWQHIICGATTSLANEFYSRPLIYRNQYRHTNAGSITLGWKFEFVNTPAGELSGRIPLTPSQSIDIYAGRNLPESKRNAFVNGNVIANSGIADYVITGHYDSLQRAVDSLIPVEEFAASTPIYFACKALNCRTLYQPSPKWDGDRPLAVSVHWETRQGQLCAGYCFDNPLLIGGNQMGNQLLNALSQIGVRDTNGLTRGNCAIPATHIL